MFFFKFNPLEDYDSVLEKILEWLLLAMTFIGLPIISIGMIESFTLGLPIIGIFYIVLFSPIIIAGVFARRLTYKVKVWTIIVFLTALAIQNLFTYAYTGASIPIFMVLFLFTTMFFGTRMGLAMIGIAIVPIALSGYLIVNKIRVLPVSIDLLIDKPITWVTAIAVVIFLGLMVVASYGFIKHNFFRIIELTKQQAKELSEANMVLRSEIENKVEIQKELEVLVEKARESDRLKSAFLANMSHEIRTPMNGILGFTDLLREPDISIDQQQGYIDIIRKSGKRMLDTINDIIEVSKIETGQIEVVPTAISIDNLVEYQVSFLRPMAEKKGLTLDLIFTENTPNLSIITDESMLEAILTNLINNAIKYTDRGFVQVSYNASQLGVEFTIRDSGRGIELEKQQTIFDRFVQATNNEKSFTEGSGLGLSIVKAYIDLLHGQISLRSAPGEGSTFWFSIPDMQSTTGSLK